MDVVRTWHRVRISRDEMDEARRVLDGGAAGFASERATPEQLAAMDDEVTSLLCGDGPAQAFRVHDVAVRRATAAISANPILAALIEMVSA